MRIEEALVTLQKERMISELEFMVSMLTHIVPKYRCNLYV